MTFEVQREEQDHDNQKAEQGALGNVGLGGGRSGPRARGAGASGRSKLASAQSPMIASEIRTTYVVFGSEKASRGRNLEASAAP